MYKIIILKPNNSAYCYLPQEDHLDRVSIVKGRRNFHPHHEVVCPLLADNIE